MNQVWDGTYITNNCSTSTQTYWTYNVGTMIMGSAYMANLVSIDIKSSPGSVSIQH